MAFSYLCFLAVNPNSIGIAAYLFVLAVTEDIKHILKAIDVNSTTDNNCKQTNELIVEFVDLHADIKQLSFWTSNFQSFGEFINFLLFPFHYALNL